jgi:hypothetical protein
VGAQRFAFGHAGGQRGGGNALRGMAGRESRLPLPDAVTSTVALGMGVPLASRSVTVMTTRLAPSAGMLDCGATLTVERLASGVATVEPASWLVVPLLQDHKTSAATVSGKRDGRRGWAERGRMVDG